MAVEKIKMVGIVGKYEKLDETINAFIETGCFHPETAVQYLTNIKGFTGVADENPYSENLSRLTEIMQASNIEPHYIHNSPPVDSKAEIDERMQKLNERIGSLQDQKAAMQKEIDSLTDTITKLQHFLTLDVNLDEISKSKFVKFRFGRLPEESFDKLKLYDSNPYVTYFPCSHENGYVWGMYVAPSGNIQEVDSIFGSLFFERLRLPGGSGTPQHALETMQAKLKKQNESLKEINEIIGEFNDISLEKYHLLYSQLKKAYETFELRKYASKYGSSFMLVGWVPKSDIDMLNAALDKIDTVSYQYTDVDKNKNSNPPIKLKNPKIFKPYEYYVEMFGVPNYHEIDPTIFLAITYTLLYGIMFADLGQGIILSIIGFLMYKLKKMKLGLILIPCGITGALFGTVFGSVFGFENLLDPLYHSLGFKEKPIEVMQSINQMLIGAVAIGVVMMIIALILSIYSCIKQRKIGLAIFGENGLCGLIVYLSAIALAGSMFLPQLAGIKTLAIIGLVVPLLLIMFKEPLIHVIDTKTKFKLESSVPEFIMQSFFEAFETALSYVTNTVSFLRVGAFVLVHAGFMTVFFTLAGMMPNAVLYWVMVVFGNVFVLALEGLLVGIQALRLEFYEMFSRFYIGDGKPFTPIGLSLNNSADAAKQ